MLVKCPREKSPSAFLISYGPINWFERCFSLFQWIILSYCQSHSTCWGPSPDMEWLARPWRVAFPAGAVESWSFTSVTWVPFMASPVPLAGLVRDCSGSVWGMSVCPHDSTRLPGPDPVALWQAPMWRFQDSHVIHTFLLNPVSAGGWGKWRLRGLPLYREAPDCQQEWGLNLTLHWWGFPACCFLCSRGTKIILDFTASRHAGSVLGVWYFSSAISSHLYLFDC